MPEETSKFCVDIHKARERFQRLATKALERLPPDSLNQASASLAYALAGEVELELEAILRQITNKMRTALSAAPIAATSSRVASVLCSARSRATFSADFG